MRSLLLVFPTAILAAAQPLSFGVKAGVPLTDIGNTPGVINFPGIYNSSFSSTNPYVIGPTIEVRLPLGLAVELDALYRHLDYSFSSNYKGSFSAGKTPASAWEFPLMLKYRFHTKIARPFLAAGISWEFLSAGVEQTIPPPPPGGIESTQQSFYTGFVAGGGIDLHLLFLHFSPEIRYTRWGSHDFLESTGVCPPVGTCTSSSGPGLPVSQNQAEFLLGITF